MSDMDFSDLGREIEEKVKKFVNSQEMKDLQDNIRVTVENTMSEVRRSAKDAAEQLNKNVEIHWEYSQNGNADGKSNSQKTAQNRPVSKYPKRQLPVIKKPNGRVSGVLMSVFGTCGAVVGWTAALVGFAAASLGVSAFAWLGEIVGRTALAGLVSSGIASFGMISSGLIAMLAAGCTIVAAIGGMLRRRAKRFKKYVKAMGRKDFYSIEGLAKVIEKNEKYVIKDLKRMIRRRWFREGHLDEQETCFMLTDEAYQMYLDAQTELEQRKEEEERLKREQEILEQDPVRKQLKITVEEGKEYIRRIRDVNDEIPGEDISGKLYRLERICTRIFEHIEENPDKLSDIRKFMNYYLPTTLKLVETYYEFSIQPVQGENITTARKEIENMLDNINGAFEKMFDKLFEEDAMDISTDISVLSTMLAQEGLLEDEFKV